MASLPAPSTDPRPIGPNELGWQKRNEHGDVIASSRYAGHGTSVKRIEEVMRFLGITKPYRLGKLVGLTDINQVYMWTNGRHRPSQLMLDRMLALVLMKANGELDLDTFHPSYWEGSAA
jgi:hypothetical protein